MRKVRAMKRALLVLMPVFWPKMPPLGIAYLQSFAREHGVTVDLLDLNNYFYNFAPENLKKSWLMSCHKYLEENIFEIIKREFPQAFEDIFEKMLSYDIIGFSCFKSNFKATCLMARALKASKSQIQLIFGGPEITRQSFKSFESLQDGFGGLCNLSVAGEGERSFLSFLQGQRSGGPFVCFCELDHLNQLPFPRYEGLDLNAYPRKKAISILSSRGCVRACRFCSERLLYQKFRTRRVEDISKELIFQKASGVDSFVFHDSMLNADLRHLETLCDAISKEFTFLPWEAQLGIDARMKESSFLKMKRSGCYNLFIGLESGCDRTLKNMRKGFTTEEALGFFTKLKDAGLFFGISMIVGFPDETDEDFYEGLDFIVRHKDLIPKIEQVNPFVYYDGTDVGAGIPDCSKDKQEEISRKRYEIFVDTIKREGIRYTNAFLGNLLER